MSEGTKAVEETPASAPPAEQTAVSEAAEAAKPSETTTEPEPNVATKPSEAEATAEGGDTVPVPAKEEAPKADKSDTAVETKPATDGVLGYKSSSFMPKFRFHEFHFWFDDAPSTSESLANYVRTKDLKSAHPNAAWAQESGKGLLFYAKRVEDKSSPVGIINLSDATGVNIEGFDEFYFKAHGQKHTFQAKSTAERSNWVAAIEKKIEEAKAIKDEILGSEGYKKHMESYAKTPALAAATTTATPTSRESKKSLDAAHTTNDANKDVTGDGTNGDKETAKSRSQSRKRSNFLGVLLGKKEDKDEQKEMKKEEKAEEKETKKEDKAEEEAKEEKKEEAKATDEPGSAAEAGVATASAAAEGKNHDKHETETTPTAEKRSKRGSFFGGIFSKKDVTSPTTEKAEKDASPSVPTKDSETLPVSDTAPKIEEPIANKPIDTAAVTAPIDTTQTPAAAAEKTSNEASKETATTPTKEKKGSIIGFIKKEAAKLEGKKEVKKEEGAEKREEGKAAEEVSKDPAAAATTTDSAAATEGTAAAAAAPTEEAKPTDKRRSSLFGNLGGTIKKRTHNAEPSDAEGTEAGTKREKSQLPQRIGSLFRRPSKGVKSEEPKGSGVAGTDTTATTAETAPTAASKDETVMTNGTSPTETSGAAVASDAAPGNVHSTIHDAVTAAPEVKASA